jgi:hypothetical protein
MSFSRISLDQILLAQYMLQVQQAAANGERDLFQLAGEDLLSAEWRAAAAASQVFQHNMLNQMFRQEEVDPESQYRGAYDAEWRAAAAASQVFQHNMLNQMFRQEEADPESQYRGAYNRACDEGKIGSATRQKHSNANALGNDGKHNYGNKPRKK